MAVVELAAAVFVGKLFDATLGCLVSRLADRGEKLRSDRRQREAFAAAVGEARDAVLRAHPTVAADWFDEDFVRRAAPEIAKFWTLHEEPDPCALLPEAKEQPHLHPACVLFLEKLEACLVAAPELAEHFSHRLVRRTDASVRELLRQPATSTSLPPPPAPLPAAPDPFVGREGELAWVVEALREHRFVLVGGGPGIGKTSLTLAALHHPDIERRFGERRFFAALEAARSADDVWSAVGEAAGVAPGEGLAARVAQRLGEAPALLLLDNLETPFEADGAGTRQALLRLAGIPELRLLASIRGRELPPGVPWRGPGPLAPLAADAARALFLFHAGEAAAGDPELGALLDALGGLPLAVELVALQYGVYGSAGALLRAWRTRRTALARAGTGGDRLLDLAASIELSLASRRLSDPGRALFAAMGRLPLGLALVDAEALFGDTASEAVRGLLAVGLASRRDGRLVMLPPVRAHAEGKPLPDDLRARMIGHWLALAEGLPAGGQQPADPERYRHARAEHANIAALLPDAPEPGADSSRLWRFGWAWIRLSDTHRLLGELAAAEAACAAAHRFFEALAAADPANAQWQRELSMSWNKIGDVRLARGNLEGAEDAYEATHDILQELTAADPQNAEWQRDLSVSWERIGDLRKARGDLDAAREAYEASLAIMQKLAAADPANAGWQWDLSASWIYVGDVRKARGDLEGAREAYEASLEIRRKRAAADPQNAEWQRDLSVSWNKIGDVRRARGDLEGAREAYEQGLAIAEKLAAADPQNAEWQRDLSVSWNKIGDVRMARGDLEGAREAYEASLEIRRKRAAADPQNAQWQRDLIVSLWKLAELAERRGRHDVAARRYAKALAIARELASTGRLAPADAWMPADLDRRLAAAQEAAAKEGGTGD